MILQAKFGTATHKFTSYELLRGTISRLALPFEQNDSAALSYDQILMMSITDNQHLCACKLLCVSMNEKQLSIAPNFCQVVILVLNPASPGSQ